MYLNMHERSDYSYPLLREDYDIGFIDDYRGCGLALFIKLEGYYLCRGLIEKLSNCMDVSKYI